MSTFEEGTWVWIPSDESIVVPAYVMSTFSAGQAGKVRDEQGEDRVITAEESQAITTCEAQCLDPEIDNLIKLNDLNENSILHNLRIRFKQDKIYTSVSSILISVNPFKMLPLYTPEMMESYVNGIRDKDPHVFAIGYQAYHNMMNEKTDQSVIISGESGAGKSEATKLILQFISECSSRASKAGYLVTAMEGLDFTKEDQMSIWKVVAGLLNFGNVQFEVDKNGTADDGAKISNADALRRGAELIGVDAKALEKSLCFRNVGNRSVILVSYSVAEASTMRDALVKTLYGEIFQWLINKINSTLDTGVETNNIIGVLDIFGFECFLSNSFEQMCINYCNEKLQFHFNEHIFRLEQEMYAEEGIVVPSTNFKDNQPTLDLLELKGEGIFSMIDEEINVPKGSDQGFLKKAISKHESNPNFDRPKTDKQCQDSKNCFGIVHYAGTVYYNVYNFLEKNKDALHPDVMSTLRTSTNTFVTTVLPAPAAASGGRGGGRRGKGGATKKTLGSQFKEQQQQLMDSLNKTFPHFVRCMKPNKLLKGMVFEEDLMLAQLRYSGLLEVCRIRKLGFPVRRDFDDFFKRFKALAPAQPDLDGLLGQLSAENKLPEDQFQKGKTKIFMRNQVSQDLDAWRDYAFQVHALLVQRHIRGLIMRQKMKQWAVIIKSVTTAVEQRDADTIQAALDSCGELPFHGVHLQVIKDAKVLQQRLVEEQKVALLLTSAIEQRDLEDLRSAVAAANAMDPPLQHSALNDADGLIKALEEEIALKAEINAAVNARDLTLIDELLIKAEGMNLDCEETRQAQALKLRLEEEKEAMENLRDAVREADSRALTGFLQKCSEMGLDNPEIDEARKLEASLLAEAEAIDALASAMAERKAGALESAIYKAEQLGLTTAPEYGEAKELLGVIKEEEVCTEELAAATSARDLANLEAQIVKAESMNLQRTTAYANAIKMRDTLNKEKECESALQAATSSGNADALSDALANASALGLSGGIVDAANQALSKLGAANQMSSALLNCGNLTSQAEMEKLISEAQGMNLGGTPEMKAAQDSLERFKKGAALVAQFAGANTYDALTKLVSEADLMGLESKFPTEMAEAKTRLEKLKLISDCENNLEINIKGKDLALVDQWLKYAEDNGLSSDKITAARMSKNKLEAEEGLLKKIGEALEKKDANELKALVEEADKKGIVGDKVNQARIVADREKSIAETMAKIEKSLEDTDLGLMNEAFDMVIQLGLEGPKIEEAKKKRDELTALDSAQKTLASCVKTIEVKVFSKGGIVEGDSAPLADAISDAKAKGLPDTSKVLRNAEDLLAKMGQQIGVQQQCLQALEAGDKDSMKAALKACENLSLEIETKDLLKLQLKELKDHENMLLEEQGGFTEAPDMDEIDPEEVEVEREERRAEALNTKYRFWNFSNLRSPDDYAKGILLNKKKIKDGMLKFQESLIPKSLLELSRDNSKQAVNIHRCLLGYMGEKQMSFPATLAHDILTKGLEGPLLRDEIYMQLLKQLSHNPKAESIAKGWQLMCMCVSTFPPSEDFDKFLLNFILSKVEGHGAVRNYAKYALRTLEGMLTSGASGFVPSVEEIQAYKERPPVLATIELVDGQILSEDLPVTPDLAVGKVVEICGHFLELGDMAIEALGLFVYDVPGEPIDDGIDRKPENPMIRDLPRTPRPLRGEDYLGDIIVQKARQGRNFKFVFKKKIFLTSSNDPENGPEELVEDEQYSRLVYLQAEDEVITSGNLKVETVEEIVQLASYSMAYNFTDETSAEGTTYPTSMEEFNDNECMTFIPESWHYAMTEDEWANTLIGARDGVISMDHQHIETEFIKIVMKNPYYGGHLFCCKKAYINNVNDGDEFDLPEMITLCYREDGLHLFSDDHTHLYHFGFADIIRWGGSSRQFSLVIWNSDSDSTFEVMLHTAQAADMAATILDHINALMQDQAAGGGSGGGGGGEEEYE
ncbi:hypothetical protein TrLO_g10564 [Triparma laevis f. longispina]|uniref:Uncharacterized protein n=1 Tax=Triparma laevis f. longispina TaxID=1714387 RepID=A0A9W7FTM9_9STRA|nr:hypothetical protein TrLO_g10564 [Triparma laevis f. longispina]